MLPTAFPGIITVKWTLGDITDQAYHTGESLAASQKNLTSWYSSAVRTVSPNNIDGEPGEQRDSSQRERVDGKRNMMNY